MVQKRGKQSWMTLRCLDTSKAFTIYHFHQFYRNKFIFLDSPAADAEKWGKFNMTQTDRNHNLNNPQLTKNHSAS